MIKTDHGWLPENILHEMNSSRGGTRAMDFRGLVERRGPDKYSFPSFLKYRNFEFQITIRCVHTTKKDLAQSPISKRKYE